MVKNYLSLIILLIALSGFAQNRPFITTWEIGEYGFSITIPTEGTGYNYSVDFGDGTILNNQTGNVSHTYATAGIYTVSITGDFPRIYFAGNNDIYSLRTVEQWGDIQWQTMERAFEFRINLSIDATDAPDLSQVTNLSRMFADCWILDSPINHWDVSTITNMSGFLHGANFFNHPLDSWNVSNVTNMSNSLASPKFNQPLDTWDVSNVTDMSGMFQYARTFNQNINNWDVSNVTNMAGMFAGASSFNQPLNNWDVSNVKKMGDSITYIADVTGGMFEATHDFNQDLSSWDVSNVEDFSRMFATSRSFNQDLSSWDTSNATLMEAMFYGAAAFNQPLNSWNVSNVTNMKDMFHDEFSSYRESTIFNQPINEWDISNVTNMENMFRNAGAFNQDLSTWQFNLNGEVNFTHFLSNSGLDRTNYDNFLISVSMQPHLQDLNMGAVGVEYCNLIARSVLVNVRNWTITGDILAEECVYNKIVGVVTFDENNDFCESYEDTSPVNDIKVTATDGINIFSTFVNNSVYTLPIDGNNFTVQLNDYPDHFSPYPDSQLVVFTQSDTEIANFCILKEEVVEDLKITILPLRLRLRGLGHDADYRLVIKNVGTEVIGDTEAYLTFEEGRVNFISASPEPDIATNNQLTFSTGTLRPFETKTIDIAMRIFNNQDRETLEFIATISPDANDATPEDNTFHYIQNMENRYAPGNKQVLEGEEIFIGHIDQYLHYLVPFQNTSSVSAVNIRIRDTLDSKLDWNTLQPINASHDYRIEITDGNQMEFIFENINLPDSNTDELSSHGFVAYKIKPRQDIQVGDIILGQASIYFDFNDPIVTNTVSTIVVDNLGVADITNDKNIIIYPNPVNDILHIQPKNGIELEEVAIYNIQGRQLLTTKENPEKLDLSNLNSGVYLIKIKTKQGERTQQLLIKK